MRYALVIVISLLSAGCLWAQDTELKLYRPFGEAIHQPAPVIVEKHEGQCWQQAQHIKREDAWRCLAEGKVYDPCFVKKFSENREALCPHSPWVAESVLIQLTSPLDNTNHQPLDLSQTYPWAMELTTGEKCEAIDEGEVFDNLPVRYRCDSNSVLIGHLQRCKAQWTVLQRDTTGHVATVEVKKAWF